MTARELVTLLERLPIEQLDLPVMYMNEVWLNEVHSVRVESENEFGVQDAIQKHLRLES